MEENTELEDNNVILKYELKDAWDTNYMSVVFKSDEENNVTLDNRREIKVITIDPNKIYELIKKYIKDLKEIDLSVFSNNEDDEEFQNKFYVNDDGTRVDITVYNLANYDDETIMNDRSVRTVYILYNDIYKLLSKYVEDIDDYISLTVD